jgi:predicted Zn-dependent peptidase
VLRGEIGALAAGKIDKGALSQARWSLAQEEALRFQTGMDLAAKLFELTARGLPPETLMAMPDEIRRVDARDVARAFAPCTTAPVLSLVGDEALIRGAL